MKRFAGEDILIVICGTKLDLVRQNMSLRQVDLSQAKEFVSRDPRVVDVVETSSKEDTNIDSTFSTIAARLVQKYQKSQPAPEESFHLGSITPSSTRQVGQGNCSC